jgi:diguanylate cyclase (GGDEF)-like protein
MMISDIRPAILIVDDIDANRIALKRLIKGCNVDLAEAASGVEALNKVIGLKHLALILLDVQMPGMDGYEVATLLQEEKQTRRIPIIFLTAIDREEQHILKGYSSGAIDFMPKPINPDILLSKVRIFIDLWQLRSELEQEIVKRREAEKHVHYLAYHDELTGLPNRRALMESFERELSRSNRTDKQVLVLMIDLDGFKAINDNCGHEAGDFVLKEVATRLKQNTRTHDIISRIGGDEFVILLTDVSDYRLLTNKIEQLIEQVSLPSDYQGKSLSVGASVGIAMAPTNGTQIDELLAYADNAMYSAKRSGGNQLNYHEGGVDGEEHA